MKKLFNKFSKSCIYLIGSILMFAPIMTIACTTNETSAQTNKHHNLIKRGDQLLLQNFFEKVAMNEFGDEYLANLEQAWNFWAASQLKDNKNFWVEETSELIKSGIVVTNYFEVATGWNKWSDNTATNKPTRGYYPNFEKIGKKILQDNPTSYWLTTLAKMLLAKKYLTTATKSEVEKMLTKEFKNKDEWPKNLHLDNRNYFLLRYLLNNPTTFVWSKTIVDDKAVSIADTEISDAQSFNALDPENISLLSSNLPLENKFYTSNRKINSLNTVELYNYKGKIAVDIRLNDLDYSKEGLRKRLSNNSSKSGFANKKGEIVAKAKLIMEDKRVKAIYVIQFVPWFEAKKADGTKITSKYNLSDLDEEKSFYRLDTNLINNASNLTKVIFNLALADNSILNSAKKFMVVARKYGLENIKSKELIAKMKDEEVTK